MMCCANAVPRSKRSVTLATRQPSFSAPTRFSTGTRASSRKTSQKWLSPSIVRIGRTVDARLVHVEDQPGDARVLRRVGVGADEQLAVVGDVGARAPDLLPADDVLVAAALRARAQRGEIRARPAARRIPGTTRSRRRGCAAGGTRAARRCPRRSASGPACIRPTKFTPMYGRARARVLLEVDELLADRQPAAAELAPATRGRRSRRRGACAAMRCRRRGAPASRRREAAGRARAPPSRATRGPRRGTPRPRGCSADPCVRPRANSAVTAARSTFAEAVRGSASTIRISAGSS